MILGLFINTLAAVVLIAASFDQDKTSPAHSALGRDWRLVELRGVPFEGHATLMFAQSGNITGAGPCNRFTTKNIAPYPRFDVGQIAATRRACPDLMDEATFFAALEAATAAGIENDTMILSGAAGILLVFKAAD
tara:strand:+ start:1984 stop:2388 length:405 start_codon:yes stop_codon:yes gene_type:complete